MFSMASFFSTLLMLFQWPCLKCFLWIFDSSETQKLRLLRTTTLNFRQSTPKFTDNILRTGTCSISEEQKCKHKKKVTPFSGKLFPQKLFFRLKNEDIETNCNKQPKIYFSNRAFCKNIHYKVELPNLLCLQDSKISHERSFNNFHDVTNSGTKKKFVSLQTSLYD